MIDFDFGNIYCVRLCQPLRLLIFYKTISNSIHYHQVLDARGSCDNSQLVSCGMDKTVIVWDVSTGSALRKYRWGVVLNLGNFDNPLRV